MSYTAPLPLEPLEESHIEERRLWIGNLDPRITDGPLAGQPRGYAFVTYTSVENASKARMALDGKVLGSKRVALRPANTVSKEEMEKPKKELKIPALSGARNENKISREMAIRAIEAKLITMEHDPTAKEFEITLPKNQRATQSNQASRPRLYKPYVKRS